MHFSHDSGVSSVLDQNVWNVLGCRKAIRRIEAKEVFNKSSQTGVSICTACYPQGEAHGCVECFTPRKLRFSALASCVALPPESIQSSGRRFIAKDGMYAGKAGAFAFPCSQEKITIFRGALPFRNNLGTASSVIFAIPTYR